MVVTWELVVHSFHADSLVCVVAWFALHGSSMEWAVRLWAGVAETQVLGIFIHPLLFIHAS